MATTASPMAANSGGNAPADLLSSSPGNNTEKLEDSSFLSSDAGDGDSSMLRHPKGKRKRTAAKDKSILESAYLANPKPDKTARLDIVSQVSLNEKEVQIWFQNRRQNDRRKSRPLSPQEIAALRYGGMHPLSSDNMSSFGHPGLSQHSSFSSDGASSSPPHHPQFNSASMMPIMHSTTPISSPDIGPWAPEALARRQSEERQQQLQQTPNHMARSHDATENGSMSSAPAVQTPATNSSFSSSIGSVGYLANRWNMHSSFSTPSSLSGGNGAPGTDSPRDDSVRLEPFVRSASASSTPVLPPPTQQQQAPTQRPFRLCLSLEGKAEVIPSQSPSPPRRLPLPHTAHPLDRRSSSGSGSESTMPSLPAIRRSGLNRSQSAITNVTGLTLPPISSLTNSLASGSAPPPMPQSIAHPPRLLRGRSRDVHAWESVCDAETRVDDELSAHAENEASGSAIAAISLLRSASSTSTSSLSSVLQPNGNRRNNMARPGVPRPGQKRTKLGRALSSVARMQNSNAARESWEESTKDDKVWVDDEKKKKLKLSTLLSGGGDSDKENWSPDSEGRPVVNSQPGTNARRTLPASRNGQQQQRSVLGEGKTGSNTQPASRAAGKGNGAFDGLDIYEDAASDSAGTPAKRIQLSRATTLPAAADVEHFMRGTTEVSPSKKGDMDCVAGLLSLSQGNWR
ncbi:homeobox domain-containing protein [Ophiostoma piceae UAMH 11346]|uniref:Homeobox domain-containing protein n=1 Tax=Ophiostoma piceae (strain UAMH 11346) TaxID=1262450 RepID=S3CS36_OPHP1|nr:homeobox domain-containing protein [Ophiostoma piceae UAMH 11346]